MEVGPMTKLNSLEDRIVNAINNPNSGSAELSEILIEVEGAITTAEATAEQRRANAVDLVAAPDAKAAHDALVETELTRDRLRAVLPADSDEVARAFRDDAAHGYRHDVAQGACLIGC
jgi:hypothetical protein